ncbi:MKK3, partial [Symbiodinium necroappetens]
DPFAARGFLTKASKAQPPVPEHMVQGVTFHLGTNGIMLSPTPIRVKKILEQLHRAVDEDALAPDEAAKLAGRVAFLAQAVFGSMARAATKDMRFILYDAADMDVAGKVYYAGVVPECFVKLFWTRKAYIYMLEVFPQLVAFVTFATHLPQSIMAFIDNTAGQAVFSKGYGKDTVINDMISAFWSLAAYHGWFVEFEGVPCKANVADAVSRDDCGRARCEGWTRDHSPHDEILRIFANAVGDSAIWSS